MRAPSLLLVVAASASTTTFAFTPRHCSCRPRSILRDPSKCPLHLDAAATRSSSNDDDDDQSGNDDSCWNPQLRKSMGAIAALGVAETLYLTYTKLSGSAVLCPAASSPSSSSSSCTDVLNGPFAQIPGTEIPLAALGCLAYATVLLLAVGPLLSSSPRPTYEDTNRVLLTAATTTMGVFSVGLMSLLFGVLHQPCPYCVFSAVCSIVLAKLSWLGGVVPKTRIKEGIFASAGGSMVSLAAAAILFTSNDATAAVNVAGTLVGGGGPTTTSTLLAAASDADTEQQTSSNAPPEITTESSPAALALGRDLQSLDANFFGAFWCSHCYEQKQALGKKAMAMVPYVECAPDGVNSQNKLCKEKKVPGYPTWEIAGKLYPGEQALEELQEIVEKAKASKQ